MPEYSGIARNGKILFVGDDMQNASRWLHRNEYKWIIIQMMLAAESKDPKTQEQLGYYWGLLFREIHKQMLHDGQTQTIQFKNFTREIPITRTACHEIITNVCGRIGKNGALMRLSDCDKDACRPWIDNVLNFAGELNMNTDKLKALRTL